MAMYGGGRRSFSPLSQRICGWNRRDDLSHDNCARPHRANFRRDFYGLYLSLASSLRPPLLHRRGQQRLKSTSPGDSLDGDLTKLAAATPPGLEKARSPCSAGAIRKIPDAGPGPKISFFVQIRRKAQWACFAILDMYEAFVVIRAMYYVVSSVIGKPPISIMLGLEHSIGSKSYGSVPNRFLPNHWDSRGCSRSGIICRSHLPVFTGFFYFSLEKLLSAMSCCFCMLVGFLLSRLWDLFYGLYLF